ncbi:MAG: hypothetical protein JNM56_37545 [Planctomycetia bacterium]|nr:hypothetical protein [Planctomycetia bacterium]
MPIHDWSKVERAFFHDFNLSWAVSLSQSLNAGLLPRGYFALCETAENHPMARFVDLGVPARQSNDQKRPGRGRSRQEVPPSVWAHRACEQVEYAEKVITIRRSEDYHVVAAVRVVTADNKRGPQRLASFVKWAFEVVYSGKSLLLVDPFPAAAHDPRSVFQAIWGEFPECDFDLPDNKPYTMASFIGTPFPEVFVEPLAAGESLPDMPLFLDAEDYVNVPLEATYRATWEASPKIMQQAVETGVMPEPDAE